MAVCTFCDFRVDIVAPCGGDNCEALCCPIHLSDTSLCPECEAEQAKGIWCPPARDVLLRLSGATVGHERLPLVSCPVSGEPSDECEHLIADEVTP